jgi:molybdopterin molybdotransferase
MKLLNVDTIEEVHKKLKSYFQTASAQIEMVPLRQSVGRYLGEDIFSDVDMPQFRRSVVDGYAVLAKDTFGVSDSMPVFLEVAGTVDMGKACDIVLEPGQAVYVPTGGMLPQGSDSMVMIEYIEKLDEKTIAVYKPAAPNSKIMNPGDDFRKNEILFSKGHRIAAKDIGLLAAVGKAEVPVLKKPKMSILSTGDEIIEISEIPKPGEIRDINSSAVAAFAEKTGVDVRSVAIVEDSYEKLRMAVAEALKESDLVVLSGGSSAGTKDMTAEIIDSLGEPGVITHGIAMKPGKPTIIGVLAQKAQNSAGGINCQSHCCKLVVGLPGHPMAAIIVYEVVVSSFIKQYYFYHKEEPLTVTAAITENIHAGEGRETYQLVSLKRDDALQWIAEPIHAKSGSISQLMLADGFVRIPSLSEGIDAKSRVEVVLF